MGISLNKFNINNLYTYFRNYDPKHIKFSQIDFLFIFLTTAVGLFSHFYQFGHPRGVVFDEVYFGNFTNYYQNGSYFFDIHPPLGKLMLYFGSKILGYRPKHDYNFIGEFFRNKEYKKLRFWPCLFGAFRSPVFYLTLRFICISPQWSFVSSVLIGLDQALIVESRFILTDSFLSFFACCSLMFSALLSQRLSSMKKIIIASILGGFFSGCAVSVKFTAAGVALSLILVIFINYPLPVAFQASIIASLSGVLIFLWSFWCHFYILDKVGPGCPFHEVSFCETLNRTWIPKFIELLPIMLSTNFAINDTHPYSSRWWEWPLMAGFGTYMYIQKDVQIWCVGTPSVWYFGTIGLFLWFFLLLNKPERKLRSIWILFSYTISFLPFICIKRSTWNYHYFIPLIISIIISTYTMEELFEKNKKITIILQAFLFISTIVFFILYIPFTYGLKTTTQKIQHVMLPCWHY